MLSIMIIAWIVAAVPLDISGDQSIRFDYWRPTNASNIALN